MSRDSYIKSFDRLAEYGQDLINDANRFSDAYNTIKQQAKEVYDNGWDDQQQIEIMECIDRVNRTIEDIVEIITTYGNAVKDLAYAKDEASRKFRNRL